MTQFKTYERNTFVHSKNMSSPAPSPQIAENLKCLYFIKSINNKNLYFFPLKIINKTIKCYGLINFIIMEMLKMNNEVK